LSSDPHNYEQLAKAHGQRRLLVLNKADAAAGRRAAPGLQQQYPDAIVVSAKHGTGLRRLKQEVLDVVLDGERASGEEFPKSLTAAAPWHP
jgi:50S ribosomal subunit-associated GTPase HflX